MNSVKERYVSHSERETLNIGERLATDIEPGDCISLEGDLGAGKTALVKGIAKGLGIRDTITSPTFTLVNSYEGVITLHHFDVYRINDPEELFEIGWDEYFNSEAVCVVEWGDLVKAMLPENAITIRISSDAVDPGEREITVERQEGAR